MRIPKLDGAVGGGAHALSEQMFKSAMAHRATLLTGLLHDFAENVVEGG